MGGVHLARGLPPSPELLVVRLGDVLEHTLVEDDRLRLQPEAGQTTTGWLHSRTMYYSKATNPVLPEPLPTMIIISECIKL